MESQLEIGIRDELKEHGKQDTPEDDVKYNVIGTDREAARKIAAAHLSSNPYYYSNYGRIILLIIFLLMVVLMIAGGRWNTVFALFTGIGIGFLLGWKKL